MDEKLRVSAASLARIELDKGLLVGLNKGALEIGIRKYTPFGGALKIYNLDFLVKLGAVFENGDDLRFSLSEERFGEFEAWFMRQEDRETSPYRELEEELVKEDRVFSELPEDAVNLEYLRTVKPERERTLRRGHEGELTQRIYEIYGVSFISSYEAQIRQDLKRAETKLAVVSDSEIYREETFSGVGIGTNCLALIE